MRKTILTMDKSDVRYWFYSRSYKKLSFSRKRGKRLNDLRHRDNAFVLENGLHLSENRSEIIVGKVGIVVENLFLGPASGFEPKQEPHGDPRTPDPRPTTASVRVSDDPLV